MADAPDRQPTPAGPALICYDGSAGSKHAIAVAGEITRGGPAIVLHLWEPPAGWLLTEPDPFGQMPVWSPEQLTEVDTVVRERAGRLLAEGVTLAREAGFDASGRLEPSGGAIWRQIVEVSDELDAIVIVLGARGLSAVESAILGSVSNAIAHHTKRPLLIVPVRSA